MSSRSLYRLSGGTLIVGSLLIFLNSILGAILFPGHSSTHAQVLSAPWLLVTLLVLVGSLLFVIGLPSMYLRQAGRAGVLGLIGFILLFLAILLQGAAFSSVQIVILPFLAQKAPQLMAGLPVSAFLLLLISGLMQMIGAILLGIATMRASVFPRWAGILLLASGILLVLTIPPLPSLLSNIIEVASFITLAVAFISCGYTLMVRGHETAEVGVPSVVQAGVSR